MALPTDSQPTERHTTFQELVLALSDKGFKANNFQAYIINS